MHMTSVSNWQIAGSFEDFVEMVLRFFCKIIPLLLLVNIVSVLVKFVHIGRTINNTKEEWGIIQGMVNNECGN